MSSNICVFEQLLTVLPKNILSSVVPEPNSRSNARGHKQHQAVDFIFSS